MPLASESEELTPVPRGVEEEEEEKEGGIAHLFKTALLAPFDPEASLALSRAASKGLGTSLLHPIETGAAVAGEVALGASFLANEMFGRRPDLGVAEEDLEEAQRRLMEVGAEPLPRGSEWISDLHEGVVKWSESARGKLKEHVDDPLAKTMLDVGTIGISGLVPIGGAAKVAAGAAAKAPKLAGRLIRKATTRKLLAARARKDTGSNFIRSHILGEDSPMVYLERRRAMQADDYLPEKSKIELSLDEDLARLDEITLTARIQMGEIMGIWKEGKVFDADIPGAWKPLVTSIYDDVKALGFIEPAEFLRDPYKMSLLRIAKGPKKDLLKDVSEWSIGVIPRFMDHWLSRPSAQVTMASRFSTEGAFNQKLQTWLLKDIPKISDEGLQESAAIMQEASFLLHRMDQVIAKFSRDPGPIWRTLGEIHAEPSPVFRAAKLRDGGFNRGGSNEAIGIVYEEMIDFLKNATTEMASQGYIPLKEVEKIRESGIRLFTRSYRSGRSKNWRRELAGREDGQDVLEDAVTYTKENYKSATGREYTDEEAATKLFVSVRDLRMIDQRPEIAPKKMVQYPAFDFIVNDDSIPAALKKFYGEDFNFRSRFQLSARDYARDFSQVHMANTLVDQGKKLGVIFDEGIKTGYDTLAVLSHGSQSQKVYTSPELSSLMHNSLELGAQANQWAIADGVYRVTAAWKVGKTVYSPLPTGMNNIGSNFFMMGATGDTFNARFWKNLETSAGDSMRLVFKQKGLSPEQIDEELALIREGLSRSSVITGEIDYYQNILARRSTSTSGAFTPDAELKRMQLASRKVNDAMKNFYSQGDVVFKRAYLDTVLPEFEEVMRFGLPLNERVLIQEVYGSSDPVEMATTMINATTQNYSAVPEGFRRLGRNPLVAPFISFTYESSRNLANGVRYMLKDAQIAAKTADPTIRSFFLKRSLKRGVGLGAIMGGAGAVKKGVELAIGGGLEDRQEEAFERRMLPEYSQGSTVVYTRINPDGEIGYWDMGRMFYFAAPQKAVKSIVGLGMAMMEDDGYGERSRIAMNEMISSTIGLMTGYEGIASMAVEQFFNQRLEDQVVETIERSFKGEQPTPITTEPLLRENVTSRLGRIRYQLLPGTVNRVFDATKFMVNGKWVNAAMQLNPMARGAKANPRARVYGSAADWSDRFSNLRRSYGKAVETGDSNKVERLKGIWKREIFPALQLEIDDWKSLGLEEYEIDEAFSRPVGVYVLGTVRGNGVDPENPDIPKFDRVFRETEKGILQRMWERE